MDIQTCGPRIWRGPHPLTTEDFNQLKSLGIQTILNLEAGYFDFFHGRTNQEFDMASQFGMQPLHIQCGDIFPPKMSDIQAAIAAMAALSNGKVYVHCLHGVDRTGIVCAAYRVKVLSWNLENAIDEMYSLGFHKFPYEWLGWENRLREFCK